VKKLFLFFILITLKISAQGTAGFYDDRGFFFTYMNGSISKQEILSIDRFYTSRNYVAYIDRNGNFKFIANHKKYTIFPIPPTSLQVSNYLMAYTQGLQLGVFNGKESKKVETFTNGSFKLGDSVLAYLDNYDILKVYVYDTIFNLMNFSDSSRFHVSDNMVTYQTLDNKFKVFYNKSIYDLEDITPNNLKMGRGIIAYNDFIDNFKVFDNGMKYTLETYEIENYELSNDMMTYQTNVNEWMAYYNGQKFSLLATAPKRKLQKRNVLAYADNANNFYVFYKGKKTQLENYTPAQFDICDDILVYEDMYRVLWGVFRGEKIQISKGIVRGEWQLQNQSVVYWDLTPNIKTVWNQGNLYQFGDSQDLGK
jgi:hypothetical protein